MNNLEKYNQIFKNVFGVDDSVLNEEFTFEKVEIWDSVAHLSLISDLENEFDIMFDSEDILHYGAYFNGRESLKGYGVSFE